MIIDKLKSSNATLSVLVLALVAQMPHAADVFRLIVHGDGWGSIVHSYSYAVALELAVLLFVVQNRHTESYGFALVSIAMNLSYYSLHGVQLWSLSAVPALLVSVALPAAIARYSHAVVDKADETAQPIAQVKRKTKQPAVEEVAQPEQTIVHVDAQPEVSETVQPSVIEDVTPQQKARNMHSEGVSIAEISRLLDVHRNTVSNWLKQTNGFAQHA